MDKTKKELGRFLVAGFSAVGTDLASYYLLLQFISHSPAKTLSFALGTAVAYVFNKYFTFEKPERNFQEMGKFVVLYTGTLCANVTVNKMVLIFAVNSVFLGFLAATGVSTILNFFGQKFWVFRS